MKDKKNTLINICAALVTFVVQMFISFWLSPFVVKRLGEEAYGFINLANNFVSYASLLTVMVNSMASRYISVEYNSDRVEEAKKYYSTVFFANCILFCLILVASVILINRLDSIINISNDLVLQVKFTFMLSFINMGISLLGTVYTSAAFSTNKMHYNSIVQIISNLAKSALVFALFTLLPAKIYYFSAAMLFGGIVTLIGNYLVSSKLFYEFSIRKQYFEFKKLVILIKSGIWVLVSNISNLLLNGLDLLLSNWFISNAIMGRLSLAKQIPFAFSSALGIFSNIFASSLTIAFSKEGNKSLAEEALSQLRILTFVFTVPYAGIIIFGKSFLTLWLRDTSYTVYQLNEIYLLMIIILIDIIVSTYMYSIHSVFIALDKVKSYSVVLLISSFISAIGTVFLLRTTTLGVYAIAGTSTVVLGITHGIIVPALAAKFLNERTHLFWVSEIKSFFSLLVMSFLFFVLAMFTKMDNWFSFAFSILIVGLIGYLLSFFLILNTNERKSIINLLKKWNY